MIPLPAGRQGIRNLIFQTRFRGGCKNFFDMNWICRITFTYMSDIML